VKRLLLLLCILALALPLLPCGAARVQASEEQPLIEADPLDASDLPESPERVVRPQRPSLTFWCSSFPLEQGWAVEVTRRWNELNPERPVRLQAMPAGRLAEDVFREAIRQGATPDLTNHLFPVNTHEFAGLGALLPLDRHAGLMQHLTSRSGVGSDRLFRSADGQLYQFPWKSNPVLLQCNLDLLRRHGVRLPRTYSEFLRAGRVLAAAGGEPRAWLWSPSPTEKFWERYYDFFPLYLAASGGQTLLTEQGRANFDNPAGVAVMAFLADVFAQGVAPRQELDAEYPSRVRPFLAGELGMIMTGPWNMEEVRDAGGDGVDFDFIALPVPDDTPPGRPVYTYGNFRNFGIFKGCRNPDLAAEFIAFATSREHDLAFLEATHQLPFRVPLTTDPDFVRALQQAPAPLAKFALQSPWVRSLENAPHLNEVFKILSEELVLCALREAKTPRQAIQDAARRVDALVTEASGRGTPRPR